MSDFFQTGPELKNTFELDPVLQQLLKRKLPQKILEEVNKDFHRFGERLISDLLAFSDDAEANPPKLVSHDPWGRRIDEIVTSNGWKELDKVSAEEGIVATGYERKFGHYSRLIQFAKIFLYHPSSAYYTCPLAMTDGAAKLIEDYGDEELKKGAFSHLTSRDPNHFWTSGQWMTEKSGGSDISNTETIARKENGEYRLYGVKWFTSATTSQMAMTLARIEDDKRQTIEGSRGLSLFYLELRDGEGKLQNIEIQRLKDKLGTKALPTAELQLKGVPAKLVGEVGAGVKTIATLFNVTRIYNACTTMGAWKRLMDLARDYAEKRQAFGKTLNKQPLHLKNLAHLEVQYQASFHLAMYVAELLGIDEVGTDKHDKERVNKLLRFFTPIAKLYTAKNNIIATSELVESFGGAGYVEDTGIPKWLRDNQTLTIWEGTTNVLSLDVLRSMAKEDAFKHFASEVSDKLHALEKSDLSEPVAHVTKAFKATCDYAQQMPSKSKDEVESLAREFAFTCGNIMAAILLLEHAHETSDERAAKVAMRFCSSNLYTIGGYSTDDHQVVFAK